MLLKAEKKTLFTVYKNKMKKTKNSSPTSQQDEDLLLQATMQ